MSTETLKFKGRLLEKEQEARRLELRIRGLVKSVRDLLDPFEQPRDLDVETAAAQMLDLASVHIEYKAALAEIAAVKKALGMEN